jgi:hypothetical protein
MLCGRKCGGWVIGKRTRAGKSILCSLISNLEIRHVPVAMSDNVDNHAAGTITLFYYLSQFQKSNVCRQTVGYQCPLSEYLSNPFLR